MQRSRGDLSRPDDPLASIGAQISSPPLTSKPVLKVSIAVGDLERPALTVGKLDRSKNLSQAPLRPVHARREHPALRLGTQEAPDVAFHGVEVPPLATVEFVDEDSLRVG
jgi:S1-C subfamily serine protease